MNDGTNDRVVVVPVDRAADFYFRVRTGRLLNRNYQISFNRWICIGIACNQRGVETPTRKIAYFCKLQRLLQDTVDYHTIKDELKVAITRYYEDLLHYYICHIESVKAAEGLRGKGAKKLWNDLFIYTYFEDRERLEELFPSVHIVAADYEPRNPQAVEEMIKNPFVLKDTLLFKCIAIYYDYSKANNGEVVLLEVT